ncbi:Phosphotransferase enzyme family protein [Pseudobythopirellula maris]|uniref:Phosphotransferase enzyme family protein n=1 Tax=Pseudobythopirellula maris TaxID=2527991 RepID=A0A5C5ZM62_9BACT|nr:aminoglycoside phosphotransferase family protein [Pseudobythopirellula maris]TWT88532.1 Phosphotransferase enzyme family protein [Pseudobythopirellula maris]
MPSPNTTPPPPNEESIRRALEAFEAGRSAETAGEFETKEVLAGGLSPARVWRVGLGNHTHALKTWPAAGADREAATLRHAWLDRLADKGVGFLPVARRTAGKDSLVELDGWCWELARWLPGEPIATLCDAEASAAALADFHNAGQPMAAVAGPSASLAARRRALEQAKLYPTATGALSGPQAPSLARLSERLPAAWRRGDSLLRSIESNLFAPQPCQIDSRPEHFLLTEGRVTGLVDFGAMALDTPRVDLARLLGGLPTDWRGAALAAYLGMWRPDVPLVRTKFASELDAIHASGVTASASNWLRWLAVERRIFPNERAVARRLEWVAGRLEAVARGEPLVE